VAVRWIEQSVEVVVAHHYAAIKGLLDERAPIGCGVGLAFVGAVV
jgi:hypothetical protein